MEADPDDGDGGYPETLGVWDPNFPRALGAMSDPVSLLVDGVSAFGQRPAGNVPVRGVTGNHRGSPSRNRIRREKCSQHQTKMDHFEEGFRNSRNLK